MRGLRWMVGEGDRSGGGRLATELGIAPAVARLLCQRGYEDPDTAHSFLYAGAQDLHDPRLLPDMDRAVARIGKALDSGERLTIFGDYDTDGVTSAALLGRAFRRLTRHPDNVTVRVPHRGRDGYGLSPETMKQIHAEDGSTLVISADCGISAMEAAEAARDLGIDLIVTDHHEPGDALPQAYAIVNPKRADSQYPFRELAGVGVAFKLAEAVAMARGVAPETYWHHFLDLVTLGTVADNAPLVDENRAIVRMGLPLLSQTKKNGIRTLLSAVGVHNRPVNASTISFAIAPRLNAVGRVDDAALALELLMTSDASRAQELVDTLERLNIQRREEQERVWKEAMEILQREGMPGKVILVAGENWHRGIVGIVAGRLADRFHRPALVIAKDDVVGRGSARSASNFSVIEALRSCHGCLRDFGGHNQAAGFDLDLDRLNDLREGMIQFADGRLTDEDVQPSLNVDLEVTPDEICGRTLQDLSLMEPFGAGNREPVFVARHLLCINTSRFGRQSDRPHLSLKVRGEGMDPTECVWWRQAGRQNDFCGSKEFDFVFRMEPNHFAGGAIRLNILDIAPSEGGPDGDFNDTGVDPWAEDVT